MAVAECRSGSAQIRWNQEPKLRAIACKRLEGFQGAHRRFICRNARRIGAVRIGWLPIGASHTSLVIAPSHRVPDLHQRHMDEEINCHLLEGDASVLCCTEHSGEEHVVDVVLPTAEVDSAAHTRLSEQLRNPRRIQKEYSLMKTTQL